METGARLFANYCSTCHGSGGRGSPGFPNLTDNDWLYGGQPEQIKHTLLEGRSGVMPALGLAVGGDTGVFNLAVYLSKSTEHPEAAEKGKLTFNTICTSCHGADGRGNYMFGAPNLMDDIWLYGGDIATISDVLVKGRQGRMPSHKELLSEDEIHVLTAYVYSLSHSASSK